MGKWFSIYRYFTPFQRGYECDYVNYTLNADGSFINSICCLVFGSGFCSDTKAIFNNPNHKPLEGKFISSSASGTFLRIDSI